MVLEDLGLASSHSVLSHSLARSLARALWVGVAEGQPGVLWVGGARLCVRVRVAGGE